MKLERSLAQALIHKHPQRAAVALELADHEQTMSLLRQTPARDVVPILKRMTPRFAANVLDALGIERMSVVIEIMPLHVAARLVRRLPAERTSEAFGRMNPKRARALDALLRFPEGSAGSIMDPEVMALPETMTASEALDQIRENPENARYNLYVLDAEQRLVGAVNLRELLLAAPLVRLADFMVRDPERLDALADQTVVVAHRGWRAVHALPVVDEHGAYLGAIRFRALRALENKLFGRNAADADTRESLGQLFSAGGGALLDALSTSTSTTRGS